MNKYWRKDTEDKSDEKRRNKTSQTRTDTMKKYDAVSHPTIYTEYIERGTYENSK